MKRYICGESVKGATHERSGAPLQDSKKIVKISDCITILAVADGHGSENCPRSDIGSAMAVNAFCNVICKYMESYGQDSEGMTSFVTFLNREGDMRFAQDVCEDWQGKVKRSYCENKVEGMLMDDGSDDWEKVFSLYGTTLLGMLITDKFVFSFQIGDGDISMVTADEVSPVIEAEKFLGTETHSIAKINAWTKATTQLRRREAEEDTPYLYLLSTDGFINSHASEADFQKTCRDYYNMIGQYGFHTVEDNLAEWLKETSELGCGDDVTVVMAYFDK